MRPSFIVLLSSSLPLILIQLALVLFGLYRFWTLAVLAAFFTAAAVLVGVWTLYDYRTWPWRTRAPGTALALTVGLVVGLLTALGTAQFVPVARLLTATILLCGAGTLGAYVGHRIGNRLTNFSL